MPSRSRRNFSSSARSTTLTFPLARADANFSSRFHLTPRVVVRLTNSAIARSTLHFTSLQPLTSSGSLRSFSSLPSTKNARPRPSTTSFQSRSQSVLYARLLYATALQAQRGSVKVQFGAKSASRRGGRLSSSKRS